VPAVVGSKFKDGVTIELKEDGIPLGSYPKNWFQTATNDGSIPGGMSSAVSALSLLLL